MRGGKADFIRLKALAQLDLIDPEQLALAILKTLPSQ
jgi:hypothetical protein